MKSPPAKLNWLEQCVEIHRFHIHQIRDEEDWTISKTAKALNRSLGSVSQSITIGSWLKTHEKQLRRFRSMSDALKFIRDKRKEYKLMEVEET